MERLQRVEWEQERTDERLREGAKSFAEVRDAIKEVHEQVKPKPTPTWKVAAVAVAIVGLIGGWVWQAAQYPDRDEFDHARKENEAVKLEQVRIQSDVKVIRTAQEGIRDDIREIRKNIAAIRNGDRL